MFEAGALSYLFWIYGNFTIFSLSFQLPETLFYEKETLICSKTFSITADRHHRAGVVAKREYFTGEIQTEIQSCGKIGPSVF